MTIQVRARVHYELTALPFEHPMAKHYTLIAREIGEGKYTLRDSYGFNVTKEGRYDNDGLILKGSPYFNNHCIIDEAYILEVAKEFLAKMRIGHMSAADYLVIDKMKASGATEEEVKEFSESIRTNRELMDEYTRMTFINEEEVKNEENES